MSDDRRPGQEKKRAFPGSFILFLLLAILIAVAVQNFLGTKQANVSFSYQVQHLVNMQLIVPQDSRMVALNDNLVTFVGRFRDHLTEEGKERFKYLQLLDDSYRLEDKRSLLASELQSERKSIESAADWFLQLSGFTAPNSGYRVMGTSTAPGEIGSPIIVRSTASRDVVGLTTLQSSFAALNPSSSPEAISSFGQELSALVQNFRSAALGIGQDSLKSELKEVSDSLTEASKLPAGSPEVIAIFRGALDTLDSITRQLNEPVDGVRLSQLRSVRNFRKALNEYEGAAEELQKVESQLEQARTKVANVIWFFNDRELSTRALEKQDQELYNHWFQQAKKEWEEFPKNKGLPFKAPDQPRNLALDRTFKSESPAPNYFSYILPIALVGLLVFALYFAFARQMKGVGSGAMSFGKSPARMFNKGMTNVTFKDVAGCDEAKEELQEIIEFLRNPSKFTALGGRIPKGVLCIGPPGTGKTLIAKAVAGEANRPFFHISGSDFVEMFVGVGASRIRDLFAQAKKQAPCIVFIDEIDAVGRHRGAGIGGGHDEREQTLNQLLVEMDGFDSNEGIILMAATNRPDVLDRALLRPGRFDRRVVIDLPDVKGRYEILKVHARRIKIDPSVDLMAIARSTPGSSGADLMNVLNEAALLAARKGRTAVTAEEANEARDKVRYGKERRSVQIDEAEKMTTAFHESGHAVVGLVVEHADPVDKVTIIPRGLSLGATHFLPTKNRLSYWKKELLDHLAVAMGGRVAEEIFIEDISSGARQDIVQATQMARSMVCEWGMSDKLGLIAYDDHGERGQYLGYPGGVEKTYSEATAETIDDEVKRLVGDAYERAKQICAGHKNEVKLMAEMLMEFETLDAEDVKKIMAGQWSIDEKRKRLKVAAELQRPLEQPKSSDDSEDDERSTIPQPAQ